MTPEERRGNISALATNVTMHAIALHERPVMTIHDAKTRDAIFELLLGLQETPPTVLGRDDEAAPVVATPQSNPDPRLDDIRRRLEALPNAPIAAE